MQETVLTCGDGYGTMCMVLGGMANTKAQWRAACMNPTFFDRIYPWQ